MNSATKKQTKRSRIRKAETIAMTALLVAACCSLALGQATQSIIFVDVENVVNHNSNITDQPKLVPNADITPAAPTDLQGLFGFVITIGDVVAVNGQPAKGTLVYRSQALNLVPANAIPERNAPPNVAVADTMRAALQTMTPRALEERWRPGWDLYAHRNGKDPSLRGAFKHNEF